jgi:hypothetical protein
VWGNFEGDTKYLYTMKVVSPNDLGSTIHIGIVHSKYYLLQHYHNIFTTLALIKLFRGKIDIFGTCIQNNINMGKQYGIAESKIRLYIVDSLL